MRKALVPVAGLAACTPQGGVPSNVLAASLEPAASGKVLVAKPSRVNFALAGSIEPPQTVRLKATVPLVSPYAYVADPTQVGVSAPVRTSLQTAKVRLYPISSGMRPWSTTVTITDHRR